MLKHLSNYIMLHLSNGVIIHFSNNKTNVNVFRYVSWRKKVQPLSGSYLETYDATNKQSRRQMEKLVGFPCGLERWWSSHKEKLPSLFLSLLELERGGDLLVEGPSEGGHHTSSQHSRGEALGKPTQPLFPAIFFRKLYFRSYQNRYQDTHQDIQTQGYKDTGTQGHRDKPTQPLFPAIFF